MKSTVIEGIIRKELGSKYAKQLRKENHVPCVICRDKEPVHFYAPEVAFRNLVYTPQAYTVEIKLGEQIIKAVMQDIQFHPVTDNIEHIDFIELTDDKAVSIEVPVKFVGNARGVRNGGKLKINLRKLKVRAIEDNLPDSIDLNIEDLQIGEIIKVRDVPRNNFEILNTENAVVVSIKIFRNVVEGDGKDEEEKSKTASDARE